MNLIYLRNILLNVLLIFIFVFFILTPNTFSEGANYDLAWPGMLPDNRLYKLKVLRNKIIEKIIITPVKKVEFDLLMADKTIYASKLLMEKGDVELSKETILKGEHYFSILVQDYNKALLRGKKIPQSLDVSIDKAVAKHREIFKELGEMVKGDDKKTFQIVDNFSHINYNFILDLRMPNN